MTPSYENSLTLKELIKKLKTYLKEHPENANKMIYFDSLHINGHICSSGPNTLELL